MIFVFFVFFVCDGQQCICVLDAFLDFIIFFYVPVCVSDEKSAGGGRACGRCTLLQCELFFIEESYFVTTRATKEDTILIYD